MKHLILTITTLVFSIYSYGQTFGNAILMDGLNDYITVPDNSNLNQTLNISIEAWINPCDTSNTKAILNKNWCTGNQNAYSFRIRSGKLEWVWDTDGCGNGANAYRSDNAIIQTNTWQHIAVVHTTTSVILYINGIPISGSLISGSYSNIQISNQPLLIGGYKAGSGTITSFFNGLMDEVRIWNYDVSSADILSRYNNQLLGSETGLISYYNMNTMTGSGPGLNVANNSTITGSILNGTTIGTITSPSFISFNSTCSGTPNNIKEYLTSTSIYPNPTKRSISVNLGETQSTLKVTLSNNLGQKILTHNFGTTDHFNIDIDAPKGIYFLRIENSEGETKTIKVLKE